MKKLLFILLCIFLLCSCTPAEYEGSTLIQNVPYGKWVNLYPPMSSMAYNNTNLFVGTGYDGNLYKGTNGLNDWKSVGNKNIQKVVFNGSVFVGFTKNSSNLIVLQSPDGENWTQVASSSLNCNISSVCYGNGVYAICDLPNENVYFSTDLQSWQFEHEHTKSKKIQYLYYAGGFFYHKLTNYLLYRTADGATWETVTMPVELSSIWQTSPATTLSIAEKDGNLFFGFYYTLNGKVCKGFVRGTSLTSISGVYKIQEYQGDNYSCPNNQVVFVGSKVFWFSDQSGKQGYTFMNIVE